MSYVNWLVLFLEKKITVFNGGVLILKNNQCNEILRA